MPTPLRSLRVPDDLWHAAVTRAEEQHTTVTAVLLDALRAFVK